MQKGRFQAFENAKKLLSGSFSFARENKVNIESNLEELLQFSYGMIQKKKAAEILEKQYGHNIKLSNVGQRSYRREGQGLGKASENLSHSMMCLGAEINEEIFKNDANFKTDRFQKNFKERYNVKQSHDNLKEAPTLMPVSSQKSKNKQNMRRYEDSNSSKVRIDEDSVHYPPQYKPDKPDIGMLIKQHILENTPISKNKDWSQMQNMNSNSIIPPVLKNKLIRDQNRLEDDQEDEEEESEELLYTDNRQNHIENDEEGYTSVDTQQKDNLNEEHKDKIKGFDDINYRSDFFN